MPHISMPDIKRLNTVYVDSSALWLARYKEQTQKALKHPKPEAIYIACLSFFPYRQERKITPRSLIKIKILKRPMDVFAKRKDQQRQASQQSNNQERLKS